MAAPMKKSTPSRTRGFSLIELMVATLLFTFIAGIVFSLLAVTQLQYGSEKDLMASFQSANIAIDQIARDIHSAGYPPASSFNANVVSLHPDWVALPFAWSPNYPVNPCTVGATCTAPGDFDLIVEADFGNGVQWIRYSLVGTTLMRGMTPKVAGQDPVIATNGILLPYLENVMNNAPAPQMDQIRASYPAMFPGDTPVPVFAYAYANPSNPRPAGIVLVNVCLIVQSARPDPKTGQPRVLTLTGQAMRFNPNK